MDAETRLELIADIASREHTAGQIAARFGIPVPTLRAFVQDNLPAIEAERRRQDEPAPQDELSPADLSTLWITNKYERLKRLQEVADETKQMIDDGGMSPAEFATAVREFRSYLMLAANELGQLLHRGSGDSGTDDILSVEIGGVNMESLR